MRAPHVWCCVTDFSSPTALLDYLVTNKVTAQSLSPDGKYQIKFNFDKTFHEPLDYVYFIFVRRLVARLCQQTRFIVPVESVGADRVLIVPEDSGSHRHRDTWRCNPLSHGYFGTRWFILRTADPLMIFRLLMLHQLLISPLPDAISALFWCFTHIWRCLCIPIP